jgi:hypothetical protein
VGEGESREYDIDLAWGAQIAGVVVDPAGAPLANMNVRFTAADGEQERCSTDPVGRFTCASLRGDKSYTAAVFPNDSASRPFPFAAERTSVDLAADASMSGLVLAIAPRVVAISGVVVDEAGAPIVDARVQARSSAFNDDVWLNAPFTMTDAEGRFRIGNLPPGEYELRAETLHDSRFANGMVAAGVSDAVLALALPTCIAKTSVSPVHVPANPIVWDDRIELVGWDIPATARVGEPIEVTLVFRARARILHSWRVFAHFDSATAGRRQNADHDPAAGACGTSTWRAGDVVVDRFSTTLPVAASFTLRIGFFRPSDGDGPWLNLAVPGDGVGGIELGTVAVTGDP